MGTNGERRGIGLDWGIACGLALLLGLVWTLRDGAVLSHFHLPDTDDAVRFQQIRDWIAGQPFADLRQHRLGASPGLAMHWSRLADLVPAALIVGLAPMIGRQAAELTAVIVCPPALFAVALFLVARITRAIGKDGDAITAMIVAALAFPTTTLFVPGRIDHHALQIVLMLLIVAMLLRPGSIRSGAIAGVAAVASLVIGLETAPLIAIAGACAIGAWIAGRVRADAVLLSFGLAGVIGLLAARAVFATWQWSYPGCDGFDAVTWRAALSVSVVPIVLAQAGRWIAAPPARLALAVIFGAIGIATALFLSPQCLSPYGDVAPLLARLWLGRVGEAQPLLSASPAVAIGYAGLLVAGIVATALHLRRTRSFGWLLLLVLQLGALALAFAQLRGAYAGAILAAPALAVMIGHARLRGIGWIAGAWLVSAGILYPLAAGAILPDRPPVGPSPGPCATPEAMARLATLPAGTVIAPMDFSAYALAATPHRLIAGPYHRNNAGNLAMYATLLSPPDAAHRIARRWHATHLVFCKGAADWPGKPPANSLAARLQANTPPLWLTPLPGGEPTIYVIR